MATSNHVYGIALDAVPVDTVSGANYVKKKLAFGADGTATDVSGANPFPASPPGLSHSDTFTAVATGATQTLSAPCKSFSIATKGTGAVPTSWTILLEGSLDGTNWTTVLTHNNTTPGDGKLLASGTALTPVLYMRANCTAVVLGTATNIVATILAMP